MLRFSHCVVPVGKVPSRGMALTGRSSPSPGDDARGKFLTKSGAAAGTGGRMSKGGGGFGRNLHFERQVAQRGIHGGEVLLHHGLAALAVGLLDGVLDGGDGFSRGSTPLMAKKQVCMMVLMRPPMPVFLATS
jgi:hypothetical protein